jgi:aspartyl-tRNA(Asn)/glutamyl-tRNA(Gln) amidotransferase subunit A
VRTLLSASADLHSGRTSSADLVEVSLTAIAAHNARTNAFTLVDAAGARAAAAEADREIRRGRDRGPLHGIPMSIKDLIDVAGQVTTAGSRVLPNVPAAGDATAVRRLRDAGAIFIGRTNLHEFALGTTSEDSAFGPVRHPLDPTRSAGGSSGGSAAAVATGMGLASLGTDTGGSIRIPAAACGIVGLKPAYGEVPSDGVVPLSPSLDHVGPLAATVDDAAILWAVLAGLPLAPIVARAASTLRLRPLGGPLAAPLDADVSAAFGRALERLERAGCAMISASTSDASDAGVRLGAAAVSVPDVYVNLVLPEAACWHDRFLDTRGPDYTPAVRTRLESGRTIPAVNYLAACAARRSLRELVDAALADCDALILPTLPIVAPPLGATEVTFDAAGEVHTPVRSAMLRQTQLFNLTGHPAISLPLETTGLPVGLQLVGRDTAGLLAVAGACERVVSCS